MRACMGIGYIGIYCTCMSTQIATRSKAWVSGSSLTGTVGSSPAGEWMSVVSVVLSGRGLCFGLISRLEESYRVWSWILNNEETLTHYVLPRHTKHKHTVWMFLDSTAVKTDWPYVRWGSSDTRGWRAFTKTREITKQVLNACFQEMLRCRASMDVVDISEE